MPNDRLSILVICTGNTCRSQMAHGFLKSFDSRLDVYSAGTKAEGKVNPNAVKVMMEVGIDISNHKPDFVDIYTGRQWDFVITVCDGAREVCPVFTGEVKHRLHIGFDDPSDAVGSPEFIESEYRRVRDEIKEKFTELYNSTLKPLLK